LNIIVNIIYAIHLIIHLIIYYNNVGIHIIIYLIIYYNWKYKQIIYVNNLKTWPISCLKSLVNLKQIVSPSWNELVWQNMFQLTPTAVILNGVVVHKTWNTCVVPLSVHNVICTKRFVRTYSSNSSNMFWKKKVILELNEILKINFKI
jgi:hypothetical protein